MKMMSPKLKKILSGFLAVLFLVSLPMTAIASGEVTQELTPEQIAAQQQAQAEADAAASQAALDAAAAAAAEEAAAAEAAAASQAALDAQTAANTAAANAQAAAAAADAAEAAASAEAAAAREAANRAAADSGAASAAATVANDAAIAAEVEAAEAKAASDAATAAAEAAATAAASGDVAAAEAQAAEAAEQQVLAQTAANDAATQADTAQQQADIAAAEANQAASEAVTAGAPESEVQTVPTEEPTIETVQTIFGPRNLVRQQDGALLYYINFVDLENGTATKVYNDVPFYTGDTVEYPFGVEGAPALDAEGDDVYFVGWSYNGGATMTDLSTFEPPITAAQQKITLTAVYETLTANTYTINYLYADNEANGELAGKTAYPSKTVDVAEGATLVVNSPTAAEIPGAALADANQDTITLPTDLTAGETSINVYYNVSNDPVNYTVRYHLQNVDKDEYTVVDDETVTAQAVPGTEVSVTDTVGATKTFDGFTNVSGNVSAFVASDGSTTLDVYFDRNTYYITFEMGTSSDESAGFVTTSALFGAPVSLPTTAPTRENYTFNGFTGTRDDGEAVPAVDDKLNGFITTMPASNVHYVADWTGGDGTFRVVYWVETAGVGSGENGTLTPAEGATPSFYSYHSTDSRTFTGTIGRAPEVNPSDFPTISVQNPSTGSNVKYASYVWNDSQNLEIRRDGTTIVNVYYTRDLFTLEFNAGTKNGEDRKLHVNGSTYDRYYSFQAQYESTIENLWPAYGVATLDQWRTPLFGRNYWQLNTPFEGWTTDVDSLVHKSKRITLTAELLPSDGVLSCEISGVYNNGADSNVLNYYFEQLQREADQTAVRHHGNEYIFSPYDGGYSQRVGAPGSYSYAKDIDGMQDGSVVNESGDVYSFYYLRERYSLTFDFNVPELTNVTRNEIMYDEGLSYVTQPTIPDHPEDLTFDGWYYTPDTTPGTEVKWNTDNMPNHNEAVYAKWRTNTITFNANGGSWLLNDTAVEGQTTPAFEDSHSDRVYGPQNGYELAEREGFVQDGWLLGSANGVRYYFNNVAGDDIVLYANWIQTEEAGTYTVQHVFDPADGQEAETAIESTLNAGTQTGEVPVQPFTSAQLMARGWEAGFYTATADSATTATVGGEPAVITYTRSSEPAYEYTVIHTVVDENGQEVEGIAGTGQSDPIKTTKENVIVYASGALLAQYTLKTPANSRSISLNMNSENRTAEFIYTQSDLTVGYKVNVYLPGENTPNATLELSGTKTTTVDVLTVQEVTALLATEAYADYVVDTENSDTEKALGESTVFTIRLKSTTPDPIKITFQSGMGEGTTATIEYPYNETPLAVPHPSTVLGSYNATITENYTFVGWKIMEDGVPGTTIYLASGTMPLTTSYSVIAVWTANEYTATFYNNYGEGVATDSDVFDTQTISVETAPQKPGTDPTRENYTFEGWAIERDGTVLTTFEGQTGTQDRNYYAIWSLDEVTVTFNANGGTGTMSVQNVPYDTSTQLNQNEFTREGYTFAGWTTNENGTGEEYANEESVTLTENLNLYAQWTVETYTITYAAGTNGTGSMDNGTLTYNTAFDIPDNAFTADGNYYFSGWDANADGTKDYDNEATIPAASVTGNIDLVALWTAKQTLGDAFGVSATGINESYTGDSQDLIETDNGTVPTGLTLNWEYKLSSETTYSATMPTAIDSDTYIYDVRATVSGAGSEQYLPYEAQVTSNINPLEIALTPNAVTLTTYSALAVPQPTVATPGFSVEDGVVVAKQGTATAAEETQSIITELINTHSLVLGIDQNALPAGFTMNAASGPHDGAVVITAPAVDTLVHTNYVLKTLNKNTLEVTEQNISALELEIIAPNQNDDYSGEAQTYSTALVRASGSFPEGVTADDVVLTYSVGNTTETAGNQTTRTNVSDGVLSVTVTATVPGFSDEVTKTFEYKINPVDLTVTPNATVGYGQDLTSARITGYSYNGFVNSEGDTVLDVSGATVQSASYVKDSNGKYPDAGTSITDLQVSGITANNGNYNILTGNGVLTIERANLIATPTTTNMTFGINEPVPTIQYSVATATNRDDATDLINEINGTSSSVFRVVDSAGATVTGVPAYNGTYRILPIVEAPTEITNYTIEYATGEAGTDFEIIESTDGLEVTPAPYNAYYDQVERNLAERFSVKLDGQEITAAEYEQYGVVITMEGTETTFKDVANSGTYTANVTANGYTEVNGTQVDIQVLSVPVAVTPGARTIDYGDAEPTDFAGSISSSVTNAVLTGVAVQGGTFSSTYDTTQPADRVAGNYDITFDATGASFLENGNASTNYVFAETHPSGTLTVNKAVLTATVGEYQRQFNTANPNFAATVSGWQYGEDEEDIDLTFNYTTPATLTSEPGQGSLADGKYPVDAAALVNGDETTSTTNYIINIEQGTLDITNNSEDFLISSAAPYNGTYDADDHDGIANVTSNVANATFTYSVDGGPFSATLPQLTNAGTYEITVRAEADNYDAVESTYTATIGRAALVVTANGETINVGDAIPALSYWVSGLQGADTEASAGLDVTVATLASATSVAGEYAITPSGAAELDNYTVTYVNGPLTISDLAIGGPVDGGAAPAAVAPAAPAAVAPVVAPVVAPAAPAALTLDIPDAEIPLADGPAEDVQVEIGDTVVPLAAADGSWSLLNLIMAIATVLGSAFLLIAYFKGKKKDENQDVKRKGIFRLLSAPMAILSAVIFILTQDMSLPMALVDSWTLIMAVILLTQVVLALLSRKKTVDRDDVKPQGA